MLIRKLIVNRFANLFKYIGQGGGSIWKVDLGRRRGGDCPWPCLVPGVPNPASKVRSTVQNFHWPFSPFLFQPHIERVHVRSPWSLGPRFSERSQPEKHGRQPVPVRRLPAFSCFSPFLLWSKYCYPDKGWSPSWPFFHSLTLVLAPSTTCATSVCTLRQR